jgi:STE24 endopeptidase
VFSFLLGSAGVLLLLRWYARRVERGRGEPADRMHRIQRALACGSIALALIVVLSPLELQWEGIIPPDPEGTTTILIRIALFGGVLVAMVAAYLVVYPSTARLRGLRPEPARAGGRQARLLGAILIPPVVWAVLSVALFPLIEAHAWLMWPLLAGWLLVVVISAPLIVRAMMKTKPLDPETRSWLLRICENHGVEVRDIKVLDTGPERQANALITGFWGRARYILISDRLLDVMERDELEAILAHEIGHAKRHDLLIKVAAHIGALVLMTVAFIGLSVLLDPPGPVVVLLLAGILAANLFVAGLVGVPLERRADDYAARTTDPEVLLRALEKLAEANLTKRRTGRLWNLLQQHPGIEERLSRLRELRSAVPRA